MAAGSSSDGGVDPTPEIPAIFSIRDLVVEFATPSGVVRAVDGVTYDVRPGETLGVVGESGCGKSVTVLAALGLLPQHRVHAITGSVELAGQDLLTLPPRELQRVRGRDIAMIFQDPSAALNPVQRIGDQIAEAVRLHEKVTRRAAHDRAVQLLAMVGVPQPELRATQFPHQFSGGMCQRAVIAMAIANRPKVLIADEPTTAVDVSVQAQLLEVLRLAQQETGAATVLISHDLGVIAETADRLCVMYAGHVVERGDVAQVFERPQHPYTLGLLACTPRLDNDSRRLDPIPGQPPDPSSMPVGCAFHPRCSLGAGRSACAEQSPPLLTIGGSTRQSACHFADEVGEIRSEPTTVAEPAPPEQSTSADEAGTKAVPLVAVNSLIKRFPIKRGVFAATSGHVHAVDEVSFDIHAGETLGLVGESGCGKSTTARMMIRLEQATAGSVVVSGTDVVTADKSAMRKVRRQVQMVFQDPYASLNPRLSIGDNVAEPLRIAGGYSQQERRRRTEELFDRVGLRTTFVDRLPNELSGGQRQRVAIARALALQPELVILDEPVSALDVSVQAQVLNLLNELKTEFGLAYLFVSHDLSVVRYMSDRVAVMYLGKIVEMGPRDQIFRHPQHPYTQALLASIPQPTPLAPGQARRKPLDGEVPDPSNPPSGCRFRTRCPRAAEICATEEPPLLAVQPGQPGPASVVACHFPGTDAGAAGESRPVERIGTDHG